MQRAARFRWAAIYFIVGVVFMVVVQVWCDQIPEDPIGITLWDLGFHIIPNDIPRAGADACMLALYAIAIVRLGFVALPDRQSPWEVLTRFLWIWGTLYWLRGCTIGLTRFPRLLPGEYPLAEPDGLLMGLWGIIGGHRPSQSDFMFSGHTATMTLLGLFVSYYTFRHFFSKVYWLAVLVGYWTIIASRLHYTADVVIAIIITTALFYAFHLFADPEFLSGWRASITIDLPAHEVLTLPLKLMDPATGKTYDVGMARAEGTDVVYRYAEPPVVGEGLLDEYSEPLATYRPGRYSTEARRSTYRWIVTLLGGN